MLPHEASTTWAGGTEPWASIQLRLRRPYAVDGLAISSQSPFRLVGENFPIANPRAGVDSLAGDCINSRSVVDDWAERSQFTVAPPQHRVYFFPEPQGQGHLSFCPTLESEYRTQMRSWCLHRRPKILIRPQQPSRHVLDEQQPSRRCRSGESIFAFAPWGVTEAGCLGRGGTEHVVGKG